jgi:hypothetical protein
VAVKLEEAGLAVTITLDPPEWTQTSTASSRSEAAGSCVPHALPVSLKKYSLRPFGVTDAEAAMAPGLILQLLLDRKPLLIDLLEAFLHLIHFDDHERPLGRPIIPEMGCLTAPR